MNKLFRNITFIELTLVFTIAGVVGGMAVPNYVDASQQALMQSKSEVTRSAKDLHSGMMATNRELPSVKTLAAHLQGEAVAAKATGISVRIDGAEYTLPTYTNRSCTVLTQKAEDKVACVGSIPS